MRHRIRLPRRLGDSFHIAAASAAGVGRGRANARDLERPFPGIRAVRAPTSIFETAAWYAPRLRTGHRYCGLTAARIWGIPVRTFWTADEPLHVAVPSGAAPPRTPGVRGRRLGRDTQHDLIVDGLPCTDPLTTLLLLAGQLPRDDLVTIAEAIVTSSRHYPGLRFPRPFTTLDGIRERMTSWGGFPGAARLRTALAMARVGVDSPKETEVRLMLADAGLPEPAIQFAVRECGELLATVDLAYPALKIALEYEGDGHRTDRAQWRTDIRRQRLLEHHGWIVLRLTADDLATGRPAFLRLLVATMRARGAAL